MAAIHGLARGEAAVFIIFIGRRAAAAVGEVGTVLLALLQALLNLLGYPDETRVLLDAEQGALVGIAERKRA